MWVSKLSYVGVAFTELHLCCNNLRLIKRYINFLIRWSSLHFYRVSQAKAPNPPLKMEATSVDVSPAPSGRSSKAALSRENRGTKDTFSIPSTNGTEYSSETNGMRSSIESSQGNLQTSWQPSADGITTTKTRKLSKLIPGRLKKKKKTDQHEGEGDAEADGRGRSIGQAAITSTSLRPTRNSRSQNTLDRADEGDEGEGGSPVVYDSDNEE